MIRKIMYPREEGCYEHLVGSRDTAKHPKMYSPPQEEWSNNVSSAEIEKSYSRKSRDFKSGVLERRNGWR